MPVGLPDIPDLKPVTGVRLGAKDSGISNKDKEDLAVIECVSGTSAAVTFTQNRFCAAPVTVAREHLRRGEVRALVINSGNANAGTGAEGIRDAEKTCEMVAQALDVPAVSVLPFSTGVIGQNLPIDRFEQGIAMCADELKEDNWLSAARAIMTTDLVPKGGSRHFLLDDTEIKLTGIAKGSGMIRPNMATMLAFVATDLSIDQALLQHLLEQTVRDTFNQVTVDGDTSTNDACVLLATGCADMARIEEPSDPRVEELKVQLKDLFLELAQSLVRDGEGVTKFVTVGVEGAQTYDDAQSIAFSVAESPLVKTALFASDPNWGRILAAVGRAETTRLDISKVEIWINDTLIVSGGERALDYTEEAGQEAMRPEEIHIRIMLGIGEQSTKVWTTDLSYEYVKINAEYRS